MLLVVVWKETSNEHAGSVEFSENPEANPTKFWTARQFSGWCREEKNPMNQLALCVVVLFSRCVLSGCFRGGFTWWWWSFPVVVALLLLLL